jgi:tripartite-type tricarboxylate transporter receptor subunit TctC
MNKRNNGVFRVLIPAIVATFLIFGSVTGASAATSFKGKVITIVVPSSPGGGTDTLARLIAIHVPKFLPGNPAIVVRNMDAAGGLTAANYVYAAKPNGLTLLATSAKTILAQIFDIKGKKFILENMFPLYASPQGMVYWAKKSVVQAPKDVMNGKMLYGGDAVTTGTSFCFVWAKKMLGFKTEKMVVGYGGTGDMHLEFLSGEINATGGAAMMYYATMKPYIEKGDAIGIFQTGVHDEDGRIVREVPDIPTVPELYEIVHGKKAKGTDMDVYNLLVGMRSYGKTLVLPPETPEEIRNIYMDAVGKMVKDDNFLKSAEKLNPGSPHYYGQKLPIAFKKSMVIDRQKIKVMMKYLTDEYKVVFD